MCVYTFKLLALVINYYNKYSKLVITIFIKLQYADNTVLKFGDANKYIFNLFSIFIITFFEYLSPLRFENIYIFKSRVKSKRTNSASIRSSFYSSNEPTINSWLVWTEIIRNITYTITRISFEFFFYLRIRAATRHIDKYVCWFVFHCKNLAKYNKTCIVGF